MHRPQPNSQFRDLLSEGIYAIKRKEGKKISVIQDELMYSIGRESGNPLEYWRKGNIPTSQAEFTRLLQALMTRGGLNQIWLRQIWGCTDFVGLDEFISQLQADPATKENLPQKSFAQFIGRESTVEKLRSALLNGGGNQLIGIDGMGGIGKTALAYTAIEQALSRDKYEQLIWISDNPGAHLPRQGEDQYNVEYILNGIGQGLGLLTIASLPEEEKIKRLRTLLKPRRILIVLDNLERALDLNAEALTKLQTVVGLSPASKMLLISRRRFSGSAVYQIHLQGLPAAESVNLLTSEAQFRGIDRISAISEEDMGGIVEHTGGSPLALKLILGQLSFHDLSVTISRLKRVKLLDQQLDEYGRMYRNIFFDSWELLTTPGKQLLISMTHFAPGKGGTYDALKMTSGLPPEAIGSQIDELWHLAMLEVGASSIRQTRYYLHALTHHFTLSDLVMAES